MQQKLATKMFRAEGLVLDACRRFFTLCFLLGGFLSCFGQLSLPKVVKIDIQHIGPATVSDELIRANIRVKVGDPFVRPSADDDVKNLYGTGLFYNIRIAEEITPDGVSLSYLVQAKPRLTDIKFQGNKKYKNEKLLKKISSRVGDPLDERKLFTDSQEIQKMYEKSGYPGTQVKYVLSIEESAGRGTVTFEIKESPKVKIKEVQFLDNKAFTEKELRKVIKTRDRWMFSWLTGSGVYKADEFEMDRERLADFYRSKGYIDFDIKDVDFVRPTTNTMIIKIRVYEGVQYKVGAVTFSGTTMYPTNEVDKLLTLHVGAIFTPGDLRKDIGKIEDFYGTKGYIDVTASSGQLRVIKIPNAEKGTMDLEYRIEEGQKSYIEKIEIRGNTKTKDRVIRRELAVAPGEAFDMVRVKISDRRLQGLQYFEKVDSRPEATDIPNRKNLIIGVEEKNTGNVSLGAGFSTIDSVVGFVEFSQGNFDIGNPPFFTGGGQKFRVRVAMGSERQDYVISFIEPWFLGRKLSLGVDLFHRQLDYQSSEDLYNERRTGGRVSLTRALGSDFLIGSVSYGIEQVGIEDVSPNAPPTIAKEEGDSILSKVGASIAYDTRNNVTLPDHGQRTELFGEVFGGPLGGDQEFYKLEVKTAWYFKGFFAGHVLEVVGRVGTGEGYGSGSSIPFYERYYLGGLYSLRGFDYREIGPRELETDGSGYEPVGGDSYWFGTAEYSVPIIERLRFAVFYDIGMVYPNAWSFEPDPSSDPSGGTGYDTGTYADNWGIGLRLNLPIGPLRLDYGIPITAPEGISDGGKFQFGVGYTREF